MIDRLSVRESELYELGFHGHPEDPKCSHEMFRSAARFGRGRLSEAIREFLAVVNLRPIAWSNRVPKLHNRERRELIGHDAGDIRPAERSRC